MLVSPGFAQSASLAPQLNAQVPQLVGLYQKLHAAPELSHHEARTASLVAAELRSLGYTVTDHVGKYPDGTYQGFGVVAVMRNAARAMPRSSVSAR